MKAVRWSISVFPCLANRDPVAARRIHPADPRRLMTRGRHRRKPDCGTMHQPSFLSEFFAVHQDSQITFVFHNVIFDDLRTGTVGRVRRGEGERPPPATIVDRDMPFAADDLLAGIEAALFRRFLSITG